MPGVPPPPTDRFHYDGVMIINVNLIYVPSNFCINLLLEFIVTCSPFNSKQLYLPLPSDEAYYSFAYSPKKTEIKRKSFCF